VNRLLFAPETWGEGETRRMLAVAEACTSYFDVRFVDYGGPWSHLIARAGMPCRQVTPRPTPGDLTRLHAVDQRRARGELWPAEVIEARVRSEIGVLSEIRPAAVVTGFCVTLSISARVAGVPLVAVRPVTGTRHYYRCGLGRWPDRYDYRAVRRLPAAWLDRFRNLHAVRQRTFTRPFDLVARRLGAPRPRTTWDLFDGDLTLIADIPESADLGELPADTIYVGPIDGAPATADGPRCARPPWARPALYCDLRSVAPEPRVEVLLAALARTATVLCPVEGDGVPEGGDHRVRAVAPAPATARTSRPSRTTAGATPPVATCLEAARAVAPRAEISWPDVTRDVDAIVSHGDGKALLAACRAGRAVVGVGANLEQEANIDCLVRVGAAVRIRRRRLTPEALREAVDRVLTDPTYARAAQRHRERLAAWDGPGNAARALRARFGERGAAVYDVGDAPRRGGEG
jgi:hypothetical protein